MASMAVATRLRALVRTTRAPRMGRFNATRRGVASAVSSAGPDGNSGPGDKKPDAASAKDPPKDSSTVLAKPIKNLRDMMDALDILVEEAEKKVEKKYRPNMIAEFKQLNDTEGKVAIGPERLLGVDAARKVPLLEATSLAGIKVNVAYLMTQRDATLVLTSFKNFGLDMLPAWRDPFLIEFAKTNRVQVVTLNIIEDWYMKLVSGSIINGLKQKTPIAHHASTYAHFGRCDAFRTALDLYNSFVGYAHLVDSRGRVRWIAGGPATPEELSRLYKVTKELLAQQKQSQQRRR